MSHALMYVDYEMPYGTVRSCLRRAEPEPILAACGETESAVWRQFAHDYADDLADCGLTGVALIILDWYDRAEAGENPHPSTLENAQLIIFRRFRSWSGGYEYDLDQQGCDLWLSPLEEDW